MAAVFQNDERVRKRAAISVAALAVLVALISAGKPSIGSLAGGLAFAALFAFVAYRNWVAGLYIDSDSVTIRNVFLTRRWRRTKVTGADFKVGTFALAGWGYVFIDTADGKSHRVTALRRLPSVGAETVHSINLVLANS